MNEKVYMVYVIESLYYGDGSHHMNEEILYSVCRTKEEAIKVSDTIVKDDCKWFTDHGYKIILSDTNAAYRKLPDMVNIQGYIEFMTGVEYLEAVALDKRTVDQIYRSISIREVEFGKIFGCMFSDPSYWDEEDFTNKE